MVVDHTPKKPAPPSREESRQKILDEFQKMRFEVLTLAYMYAKGYDLGGENVTQEWSNAIRNTQIIEYAYRRGYEDCEKDIENNKRRDFYHKAIVDRKKK